ncbi:hypothetical protein [Peribacillus acanthi]|uniref:hypothetical protein n=1 Tax=Peribacillus acanthi TaxID=2171554 RepID=UPI000D3ECF51|nr:hypothetical protein [Peribacillus acanthi]
MMLGLTMIISFLLIAVLLILLPLGLSNKGKILVLAVCALLGLMGFVGTSVFPLWQIILIQVSLAFLLSYIFDKRLQDSIYTNHQEDEELLLKQDTPIPLYSMIELEEKAKGFETVDQYYSSVLVPSSEEKEVTIEPVIEIENTLDIEEEPSPVEKAETKDIELFEEQAEEVPERESDFIIPLQIQQDEPSHLSSNDNGELPFEVIEMDGIDFDGVDDAEALMMARMKSFDHVESDAISTNRNSINEDTIDEIELALAQQEKKQVEESNPSIELFDDLEELYKNRKQS